ncbi:Pseudouridine synthase, RsuA/RluB/C/D/E/F [Ostreococcus tauri]|uniref:Pseudouridine synthase, RsuA/RluB/C/D/E/F n=1 Tax=Ostreococcus tauri TaxID=70448 RepID=Q015D8_OSTTA|nr:Pseudouridine synthase, RsuA/RluB/C/D/E/F [Ostreococcus tauri]CAL54491.1 Pseudouridine synthase, RsuA/RluB/C/D/E/F [Ostreococcus tauri]|eukprot:XP_003080324.1 Pseudouridine synthase, RsuA/RluB/C/D/E/F [Ostreococcus tauri]
MRSLASPHVHQSHRAKTRALKPFRTTLRALSRTENGAGHDAVDAFCSHLEALSSLSRDFDEELDAYIARVLTSAPAITADVLCDLAIECAGPTEARSADREEARRCANARGDLASMANATTSAFHRLGDVDGCEITVRRMRVAGAAPDVVTFGLLASAMRRAGRVEASIRALDEASIELKRGTRPGRKKKRVKMEHPDLVNLRVLYDDGSIAAVFKPAGVLTHPAEGGAATSLMDAALARFGDTGLSDLNGSDKRGIVSRLDKPTSGVILLARHNAAHAKLVTDFYQRRVSKTYIVLVDGAPTDERGTVTAPIDDRPATSEYKVLERFNSASCSYALVRVKPKSGRKHQIRRHMAMIGCPLVGDTVYRKGRAKTLNAKPPACVAEVLSHGKPGTIFFLHACEVEFETDGKIITVEAPLAAEFETLVDRLKKVAK